MTVRKSQALAWSFVVSLVLGLLGPPAAAQTRYLLSENLRADVLDRIEPALVDDLRALELQSFVREGDRVRTNLRVVVDVVRRAGDPTFEESRARDRVAEVSAAVAARQRQFERSLDALLAPAARRAIRVIDRLTLQYSIVAEVDNAEALVALAMRPDVKYIWKDHLNKLFTNEGRALTGSTTASSAGHRGTGVGVAVIDTHFNLLHTELGGSRTLPNTVVKGGQNFSDPGTPIYSTNFNDCYHGTGTASIVRRYAQSSHLYCLTVFPNAYNSVISNAINWCVTNKNGVGGGSPIRVISMSLGGGSYGSPQTSGTLHSACNTAVSAGLLVFAASGNDGWTSSISSPAASTQCVSVGSVWDQTNANYSPFPPAYCSDSSRQVDERACYSNKASFLDLYAPSEEVICARCGGGTFALGGTSSACPAAAGLTAQLLQAAPQLIGDQAGVVSLFQVTGATVLGDTSKRRIHVMNAINSAGGGGGGGTPQLQNGVTQNYSVATGATLSYTIAVPANAANLVVTITGTGDADLYVKRQPISWPAEQGSHNSAEFKSLYIGGSSESVSFPSPAQDTWNVLVHGYSGSPSGTIRATWDVNSGGGGAAWHDVNWVRETPHLYSNNRTYRTTYTYSGASKVRVHFNRLDTETNYDWLNVFDQNGVQRYRVSGNLIQNGSGSAFGRTDGWVEVPGSSITIELRTDYSVRDWGFKIDKASAYY